MEKQEYNSNISLYVETILLLPINKTVFIYHCSYCDTLHKEDAFLEWLKILKAAAKVKIVDSISYLDLKYVTSELVCLECSNKSVTQVVFEWYDNSENKT